MKTIALIGAGQLGSRYLQGLAKVGLDANIEVVEPVEAARKTAIGRFNEIPQNGEKKISFHDGIDGLPDQLDLAIVATNSDARADIVRKLLGRKKVGYLVLEKVVFQKAGDFDEIGKLLTQTKIPTWVNHARRCYPFYKKTKELLKNAGPLDLNVMGGGWAMACNGLHLIDIFSYLTGSDDLSLSSKDLAPKILDAKRAGFKEVTGLLCGRLGGNRFSIHCQEKLIPLTITIASGDVMLRIDEANGAYEVATKENNWVWEKHKDKIVYMQTEIAQMIVEDILLEGKCDLPNYEEAKTLHLPFIAAVLEHINRNSAVKYEACPIT